MKAYGAASMNAGSAASTELPRPRSSLKTASWWWGTEGPWEQGCIPSTPPLKVSDETDNCPGLSNSAQADEDSNGIGDSCQDEDGDGVAKDKDCDDQDPFVHPGASDPYDDGVDWDCNGADRGSWEWNDDRIDSNGNGWDNCGTIPVQGPVHGIFAFLAPWVLFFLAFVRLKRRLL